MIKEMKYIKMTFLIGLWVATISLASFCTNSDRTPVTKLVTQDQMVARYDDSISEKDSKFLVAVTEMSLKEISFGQLAQQNSTMTDIKDMGKMLGTSFNKTLNELKDLATKKKVIIPTTLNEQANKMYKKLSGKTGSDFDKEYNDWVVSEQKDAIASFEKTAAEAGDEDIKAWAIASLPELRTHLDHVTMCQKKLNKS